MSDFFLTRKSERTTITAPTNKPTKVYTADSDHCRQIKVIKWTKCQMSDDECQNQQMEYRTCIWLVMEELPSTHYIEISLSFWTFSGRIGKWTGQWPWSKQLNFKHWKWYNLPTAIASPEPADKLEDSREGISAELAAAFISTFKSLLAIPFIYKYANTQQLYIFYS